MNRSVVAHTYTHTHTHTQTHTHTNREKGLDEAIVAMRRMRRRKSTYSLIFVWARRTFRKEWS